MVTENTFMIYLQTEFHMIKFNGSVVELTNRKIVFFLIILCVDYKIDIWKIIFRSI
jgi:hypothetical protein